jgi:hypothetical protein
MKMNRSSQIPCSGDDVVLLRDNRYYEERQILIDPTKAMS